MTWYMIKGYNGYEINKEGIVRSMKMARSNPGYILKRDKYGYYTLSNDRNERVRVKPEHLLDIVFNSGNPLMERPDNAVYMGGRNKRFYFDKTIKNKKGHIQNIEMDFSQFVVEDEI